MPRRVYKHKSVAARLASKRRRGRQARGLRARVYNPMPTFTETFALPRDNFTVPAGSGLGHVFKVAFNNIPQWPQYMNLYTQYKINWVKVLLMPNFDTKSADINTATSIGPTAGFAGMSRIAYSIQIGRAHV